MIRNTSPVTATVIDGALRITLKKRASARQEVEASIEGNGHRSALFEILGHYTQNGIFKWVDERHLGNLSGPALAHPDDYVQDDFGNCVYLRHVYSYDGAPEPLEILLLRGHVDFKSHTLDVMRSQKWINLRYSLYNHLYSPEFIKDVEKASEIQSDGVILIEAFIDGSKARSFWSASALGQEHSKPGSLLAVVRPIDTITFDWILNSDIVAESDRPTWGNYEEYPGLRENASKNLRNHRLNVATESIRDGIIAAFNVVEAHETDLVEY